MFNNITLLIIVKNIMYLLFLYILSINKNSWLYLKIFLNKNFVKNKYLI